jgi:hypothetical protein
MTVVVLSSVLCITVFFLCFSLYYNYKHGVLILETIDGIETALDVLDQKYASISEVLEIPLFYDSPQIRQVQADIKSSRDSILRVASLLGNIEDNVEIS